MESPMRLVCSECGRAVERSDDRLFGHPLCTFCGGRGGRGSDDYCDDLYPSRTPKSLELTPEDLGAAGWLRHEGRDLPERIGRFRVRELLGGGGFGHVYRAFDARLDRDVALKVLRDDRPPPRVVERFFREARAAAQLDHPNIVPLHDAGRDDGRCWIAYQYVAGPTLARSRDDRSLDVRRSVEIIRALADGLDHAHSRGIFHRDVKPANVILDGSGRPRLTDFGLARRVEIDATMTQDGAILGTPAYMSPEAAAGNGHRAGARGDLYSLGVMLHELICGRRPGDQPSGMPAWRASARSTARSPRSCDRKVPRTLDRVCLRALAPDPDRRYPDARSFADDLDRWLHRGEGLRAHAKAGMIAAALVASALAREVISLAGHTGQSSIVAISTPPGRTAGTAPGEEGRPDVPAASLVGNSEPRSRKFHRETCGSVKLMNPTNRVPLRSPREARDRGYLPHGQCLPELAAEKSKGPGGAR